MAGQDGEEEDQVPAVILGLSFHCIIPLFGCIAFRARKEFATKKLYLFILYVAASNGCFFTG